MDASPTREGINSPDLAKDSTIEELTLLSDDQINQIIQLRTKRI